MKCHVVAPVLVLALGCGCSRSSDPVILSLDGQVVRASDFQRYVAVIEARDGALADPVRRALLEAYLERRVLVIAARSKGLLAPKATDEDEQFAVQKLVDDHLTTRIHVSPEELSQRYAERPRECVTPEMVSLRQILVGTPNEARDIRRRVQRDVKNFDVLARTLSKAPEASAGGLMGAFSRGQLPQELEQPAFTLSPGQTSDVIQTPLGYHVLKVEAREPEREATFEECRAALRAALVREKSDHEVRQFVAGLLARAKVNHEAAKTHTPST